MKLIFKLLPISIALSSSSFAQASAPENKEATADADKPSVVFIGKTFTLGGGNSNEASMINDYYLANQTRSKFSHRLSIHQYLGRKNSAERAKQAVELFNKKDSPSELAKNSPAGVTGLYRLKEIPGGIEYSIYAYSDIPDGSGMIIKELSMRAATKNREGAIAKLKKDQARLLENLAATKFPPMVKQKKAIKPAALPPLPPLQKLESGIEQVTDIQGKGKIWIIDDAFALKNGAKPIGHTPFSINILTPKSGKVLFLTRPNVPEIIRFNLATDDKKLRQSIRFTTLTIGTNDPMEVRLQKAVQIIEGRLAPRFYDGHKNGSIVKRYKTRIGPYDGVVMLGKLTTKEGNNLFIKFVGILPSNKSTGLVAVMLLDPKQYNKDSINKQLSDGYMQQVLHSVRFLKKKEAK